MTRPSSPCPACAGPVPTSILGGEIVRERCPHCFPRRPFFRPAVEAALPDHRKRIKDALAKAMNLDPRSFEITEPAPDLPGQVSMTLTLGGGPIAKAILPAETTAETCSTCERRERLFESVPACALASPGTCRFALRRVE